jgi:hypothetical protein
MRAASGRGSSSTNPDSLDPDSLDPEIIQLWSQSGSVSSGEGVVTVKFMRYTQGKKRREWPQDLLFKDKML